MKTRLLIFMAAAAIIVATTGCSKSDEVLVGPPSDHRFITNGSFESNGLPSLEGWIDNTSDTALVNFSTDTPIGGGRFSIRLRNQWSFPGTIVCNIIPPIGTHRYQVSVWGKVLRANALGLAGGELSTYQKNSAELFRKGLHFADSTWTSGSLLDTLDARVSDTLMIMLRGNLDQFSSGDVLFDLCEIEWLD